jgi:two-component system NarL family sensor kinase
LATANIQIVEDLRGHAQQLVRSEEAQRKAIARDLHDTVLQDLFFIKQCLPQAHRSPELGNHMVEIIQKLRGMIESQRPPLLNQGLALALRGLVDDMQKIAGSSPILPWQSNLNIQLDLTNEQATSIFRIAQEAISNALKHAQARYIEVKLERISEGMLRMVIEDDGIGMSGSRNSEGLIGRQYGLLGTCERAYMVNTKLR